MKIRSWIRAASALLGGVVLVAPIGACAGGQGKPVGLRFNSPGVLDLAERSQRIVGGVAVSVSELAAADAESIFAAPAQAEMTGLIFSDEVYGCKKPSRACSFEHERPLLAASGGSVKRDGKHLVVTPATGTPLEFIDWKQPTTKTADGDKEEHWYLGRLAGSAYERVEVDFDQDSPGNFLINPQSGKIAFVHNGDDISAPSPDGKALLTFNALNTPVSVRVAALDGSGPRLILQCQAEEGKQRLTPLFKGWHGESAFDIVFEIGEQSKAMARLATRISRVDREWHLAASDMARLASIGLTCQSAPPSG